MNPNEALSSFENALRSAIRSALPSWRSAAGHPDLERVSARQVEESRRREAVTVSNDLLDYVMTSDLTTIVLRNWETFVPVLHDKKRTEAYFGIVEDVRNTIAHGRDILPHEADLLSGISRHLRVMVSSYQSAQSGSGMFYPSIESAIDNFGDRPLERNGPIYPGRRIDVGTELEFRCTSSGGRGFPVLWYLNHRVGTYGPGLSGFMVLGAGVGSGDEILIRYTVKEDDVGESFFIGIGINSTAQFHRHGRGEFAIDDAVDFHYAVNPPAE